MAGDRRPEWADMGAQVRPIRSGFRGLQERTLYPHAKHAGDLLAMRINLPLNLADFRNDRSGAAAIEIAFIAPIMILLALLGVDTANYVIATEQVEQTADPIPQKNTHTT